MIPVATAGASGGEPDDRLEAMRELLIRLGHARFGQSSSDVKRRISQIVDAAILEALLVCVFTVSGWDELFANK